MVRHNGKMALLALAGSAMFALIGCDGGASQELTPAPAEVLVTKVSPVAVAVSDELPGRVVAYRVAEIRPQVGGIVQRRFFEQGGYVRAGQPLFQINPAPFRADADSAAATLLRAEAARDLARTQAARLKPLVDSDAISRQSYDNAAAQVRQATAEAAQARAELSRRRLDLGFARVSSPISGQIGAAMVTEGALVAAQDAAPLAVVQQIDKVYVDVRQPADRFEALRRAAEAGKGVGDVDIISAAGPPYPMKGRILFSGVTVDAGTGNVLVRVEVDNPQHRLLPGMFVRAKLPRVMLPAALTVPQEAVAHDGAGKATLGVLDARGRVHEREVETGDVVNGRTVILSGLRAGETVVVTGRDRIGAGATVKALPWRPAQR